MDNRSLAAGISILFGEPSLIKKEVTVMKRFIKEFLLYPDVLVMFMFFLAGALFIVPQLNEVVLWVMVFIGMVTYALNEYMIHRFVFHMKTPKHPFLLKIIKRLHYDHHVDPSKLHLLFLPLWFSIPGFALLSFFVFIFTNQLSLTIAYTTGLIGYFLFYEWKHYVAHKPIQPMTNLGKKIKKMHLWHHFKNENYWYGVTHSAIDRTMGTYKDQKTVELSETAKDLEKR